MRGVFVTGTDTEIGKTRISCGLLHGLARTGLRVAGMKPVASGADRTPDGLRNEDALALQRAANVSLPYELVNPYAFEPPIAPHLAAAEANRPIDLPVLLSACNRICRQADVVVVEGVGGWEVPLSPRLALPALARALSLPVIMVVGMRLGCLNHAQLTARAIQADGLTLLGWVANQAQPGFPRARDNLETLRACLPVPLLGQVPHLEPDEITADISGYLADAVAAIAGGSVTVTRA